jgi:5-oxoprolinase (ATP-hydrolysing) subunit A
MQAMSLAAALDVNVDMGESFGRWQLGDDAGIMPFISSASIACGFHAGDPGTIRRTVHAAVEHGLQIGAHVALPDLLGFGRRRMAVSAHDLRDYVLYQIGAMKAFVDAEGGELGHVKPHGALYAMCSADAELAGAVARATAEVDPGMLLLLLTDDTRTAVEEHGVRLATEAFPDLDYNPDGSLIIEGVKQAWDPDRVATRALRVAKEGRIDSSDGGDLEVQARSICIHGDSPNAVAVARRVRERLEEAGVRIVALREILDSKAHAGTAR